MSKVRIEKPAEKKLESLGVDKWSLWECEPSVFDWEYDSEETCYLLEGKARVKTPAGEVEINKGDLVTFPKGLKCTWQVLARIRKVFTFK